MEANRALGLRAVATAQRLSDETLNAVLNLTDDWEERSKVYREIPDLVDDPERALALVDQLRQRTRDGNDLFALDETLTAIGERWPEVERLVEQLSGRFFDHIPEPAEDLFQWVETCDGRVELWREIPAGEGWIGAAAGEENHDHERPRHRVTITQPFAMAAVPVTNEQYAAFDPAHGRKERAGASGDELARHPVVNVTWYAAYQGREDGIRIDPTNPAGSASSSSGGGVRVIRGGSSRVTADRARSADRNTWHPGLGMEDLGFRVVLPHP